MKFISVDGSDKSGKSSILEGVWNATNGLVHIEDRSPSTWNFFNKLLDRIPDKDKNVYEKAYKHKIGIYRQLLDLAVILEVSENDWSSRCLDHKEPTLVGDLSFKEHQKQLIKEFDKCKYPNVLRLNTSEKTLDECVTLILKRIGIHK